MDLKTVIKKLLLSFILLFSLTACSNNKVDNIVVDKGNDQYVLVTGIDSLNEVSELNGKVDGEKIYFKADDVIVNKKDAYTYKNIDVNDFWKYIVKKKQLDIENKPLVLSAIRYVDTRQIGADMIYVLDNGDDWLVYSYSSIIKKNNEYYSFNYQGGDQTLDQNFNNICPAFAELHYNKYQWPIDKFEEWFDLNSYEWTQH